jgi:hypothetical protein
MSSHRLLAVVALSGLICVGLLNSLASAQSQATPAMTASPPQQMPAYGVPATYPSTDSSTPYPSTAPSTPYPSTDPSTPYPSTPYPSTAPSTPYPSKTSAAAYPSMSVPSGPALAPYDAALPGGTASALNGAGGGSRPSPSNELGPIYAPYGSPDPAAAAQSFDANAYVERSLAGDEGYWSWQFLPNGLMYKSYLAGDREPRFGTQFVHDRNLGWLWDSTIGARLGLFRYGTENDFWPQGWQFDIEGAAFPRLSLDNDRDLISADFRAGGLITNRQGPWEMKFGYYHYCSHLGDEYVIQHAGLNRINYVRESLILGLAAYANPSLRLYWETGWAFSTDGQAKPWEFQFGADFCTPEPTGPSGAPFFAINGHLREENDFSGNLNVQTGWMWRARSGHLFRVGMQYFNGLSDQAQFYRTFEEQIGIGLWYDF